ncbi:unnamed protein product [Caenorhabditis auriculariae]|uniref:Conserved oligomeric Golgi complex subunit 4 n=1 Tax=Caenorhabditis auriculariae TaxID=2777116 RepID=A0A8S1H1M4_9PELO|nr:unnamed protein product [Caenorhabditis auriculariae]
MLSELIIASTLVINGFAVLNFKLQKAPQGFNAFAEGEGENQSAGSSPTEMTATFDISGITSSLSETVNYLTNADNILKKSLRPIPAGRKRASARVLPKKDEKNEDDEFNIDFSSELKELRSELDMRRREEDRLQKEIAEILAETTIDGGEQSRSFGLAVSRLNNSMLMVENDSKQLAASLKTISTLADTISGRVSALDVAKTRVVECLQLASDMRDLGVCSEGIDDAIRNEDFETAAQHIHRFLTLDKAVFQYREAGERNPDATNSIRHSYDVLTSATSRLKKILESRLDEAVQRQDVPNLQRFVKLFPMLNEADNGIKRFSVYLNQKIDKLGEDHVKIMQAGGTDDKRIAGILEANQPIIENSYGADKLLDFISILQINIDGVVGKVLEAFEKSRGVNSRVRKVQRLLRDKNATAERIDPLELDVLLSEICLMNTHAEMYWRFIRRRVGAAPGSVAKEKDEYVVVGDDDYEDLDEEQIKRLEEEKVRRKADRERKLDQLLNRSLVGTKMQELLGDYILLEQYYMEETVVKAIDMDQKDESSGLLSSVVDDVLFIVRKCVRRAASSGSVDCVCATLNNGVTLLETTYFAHLQKDINAGYPSVGFAAEAFQTAQTAYNVIQHGKTVTEAGPDAQRETFLTALNNAKGTAMMLRDLRRSLHSEWTAKSQRPKVDTDKLEHAAAQLEDVARKMDSLSNRGVDKMLEKNARFIFSVVDAYRELPHELTMEDLAEFEAADPFIEAFASMLDKLIATHEPILHAENFQSLLLALCSEVTRQLERVIFKCQFNRYGGLQLDREFRHISAYLSTVAGWTARERCSRLSQIVALLNVETVEEAVDLWNHTLTSASPLSRALSSSEAKKVLRLRIDLPSTLVNNMDL